jgi:ribonuclease T
VGEVFFSVDIEASGPIPGRYSMLCLGACLVDDPAISFYAELQPITENAVPAALSVIGRSFEEFYRTGDDPRSVMSRFAAWITQHAGADAPVFVGFNAAFDWSFVNWYFLMYCDANPFGVSALDIKSYYMALCGVTWRDTRSARIAPKFQPATPATHDALDDARAQADMFRKMRQDRLKR